MSNVVKFVEAATEVQIQYIYNVFLSGYGLPSRDLFYLSLIPAWINNHIRYEVWDEITYPFQNFNGATVEV